MDNIAKEVFLKRRHTNGQEAPGKILSITIIRVM
jgi:hypothetical protein